MNLIRPEVRNFFLATPLLVLGVLIVLIVPLPLSIGFLIFTLILVLAVRNLWMLLLVFLFLQPIVSEAFGVRVPGIPLLLTIQRVILATLVISWTLRSSQRVERNKPPRLLLRLVLLTMLVRAISTLYAPAFNAAIFRLGADLIEYFALFLIIADLVKDFHRLRSVLMVWVCASLVAFAAGTFEMLVGWNLVERFTFNPDVVYWQSSYVGYGFQRAFSLFEHPITYGWFSAIGAISALSLYVLERRRGKKLLLLFAFFASLCSMMFAFARGAIIALMFGLLLWLFYGTSGHRRILVKTISLFAVAVLVIGTLSPSTFIGQLDAIDATVRFTDRGESDAAGSVQGRLQLLEIGGPLALSRPFGFGYAATRRAQESSVYQSTFEGMLGFENLYLGTLLETGYFGLVALLALMVWVFVQARKSLRSSIPAESEKTVMGQFFVAIIVFYAVVFLSTNWMGGMQQTFWVILALSGRYTLLKEDSMAPLDQRTLLR